MFPRLIPQWPPLNLGVDYLASIHKRGICFSDLFPTYFRLSIPAGRLSQRDILRLCEDATLLRAKLAELKDQKTGHFTITQLLLELERNAAAIPEENLEPMLLVIFELKSVREGNSLVWSLLRRLPQPRCTIFLDGLLKRDLPLYRAVEFVIVLGEPYVKRPPDATPLPLGFRAFGRDPDHPIVDDIELSKLQHTVAARVTAAATNGSLLDEPELLVLLRWWYSFGERSALEAWAIEIGRNLKLLVRVLEHFLSYIGPPGTGGSGTEPSSMSAGVDDENYTLSVERVEMFGEPKVLAEQLLEANQSGLSSRQQLAIQVLARECGLRKKAKGNPF